MTSHNNPAQVLPDNSTATYTASGNLAHSSDPSVRPDASLGQKLAGDVKGAVSGTVGSIQAATGTTIRNQGMEEKGLQKMQAEDARLAAKHGVEPVGSGLREGVTGTRATETTQRTQQ